MQKQIVRPDHSKCALVRVWSGCIWVETLCVAHDLHFKKQTPKIFVPTQKGKFEMQVTTPSRAQAKVTKLEEQLETAKIKAKAEKLVRQKGLNSALRKAETRRKILLGAFALDALGQSGVDPSSLVIAGKSLADWLERDADRMLFNLQALAEEISDVADDPSTNGAAGPIAPVDSPMEMNEEGIDFEEQALAERLDGEPEGVEFNVESTQAKTVTTASEEGSDRCGEPVAEGKAPAEMDLADHDSDLISLEQADDEQTQDPEFEDYFE